MTEDDLSDQEERSDQDVSADPDGETDTWRFNPDFRWGGEDEKKIHVGSREGHWWDRLRRVNVLRGVPGPDARRGGDLTGTITSLLKGSVRFAWPLAIGLVVLVGFDQVDPRRQIVYSRLVTEVPLAVAIGFGVVGVTLKAVSGGGPDWPSVGVAIRTTLLLALLVTVFALAGTAGVV